MVVVVVILVIMMITVVGDHDDHDRLPPPPLIHVLLAFAKPFPFPCPPWSLVKSLHGRMGSWTGS